MNPRRTPFFKNIHFSLGNTENPETCAIMEREARKVQEKEYTGNTKREGAPRNNVKHEEQDRQ